MSDALSNIEDAKTQRDIGVMAVRIYQGAREEGESRRDAFVVLVAWFRAMLMHGRDEDA